MEQTQNTDYSHKGLSRLAMFGGLLGALAASSCCILPLVLVLIGVSGAWIGSLTALSVYQPYFAVFTLICLGSGYYLVYRKPEAACTTKSCQPVIPSRFVKIGLWMATALVLAALLFSWLAPNLLGVDG